MTVPLPASGDTSWYDWAGWIHEQAEAVDGKAAEHSHPYSASGHTHDYAASGHSHSYAALEHVHDGNGAAASYPVESVNTSTYNTTLTLAAEPVGESLQIFAAGLLLTPGVDYSRAGAVVTFLNAPTNGVKIVDRYLSATAAPGESVLSGSASPMRGTVVGAGTGSTRTLALPAGTVEGDLALVYAASYDTESAPSAPTGFTSLQTSSTFGGQLSSWRVLTAGDIAAGSVQTTFAGSGNHTMILSVVKAKTNVVTIAHTRATSTNTSGAAAGNVLNGDVVLWVGITRNDNANPPAPSLSRPGASQDGTGSSVTSAGVTRFEVMTSAQSVSGTHTTPAQVQLVTLGCFAVR